MGDLGFKADSKDGKMLILPFEIFELTKSPQDEGHWKSYGHFATLSTRGSLDFGCRENLDLNGEYGSFSVRPERRREPER